MKPIPRGSNQVLRCVVVSIKTLCYMIMNVLSLFDGISCAYEALDRAGIAVKSYTAYEIDKYAICVSKRNHPNIVHKGDVRELKEAIEVDLLIGGSPCQDLSVAKKDRKGLDGDRSGLFWEYVRIKELCKPKYFILENVASMSKDARDTISIALGVDPVMIDAALVSAQSRKRLFWTNIKFDIPVDRGILLKDVVLPDSDRAILGCGRNIGRRLTADGTRADNDKSIKITRRIEVRDDGKSGTLTHVLKDNVIVYDTNEYRNLTPIECERLQGLPDGYTEGISNTQRYKCLGNAFNVDVVASIVSACIGFLYCSVLLP